jgi:hypothetical protein
VLPVEDRYAQTGTRKLQCDGPPNHSTARDGHIELLHKFILSHLLARFLDGRKFLWADGLPRQNKHLRRIRN